MSVGHDTSTDQVFIEALRITQSGPNQFTGTLESTEVNKAGKTTNNTQSVTGNFDGSHATIALDQVIGHVNREATIVSDSITMTWMQNGQLVTEQFARKSDEQYASMLQTLGHAAQNLAATDAAVAKAQEANKETAELVDRLQHFLDKEETWTLAPAETRHKKAVGYGDAGLAKVKQLLALHQFQANVSANTLAVQMNTAGIQLGLALDNDTSAISTAQQKMASLDNAIAVSPCLAPDGSLVPNPLPACALIPDMVSRYRAVHGSAELMLAQLNSINQQTRSEYDERLKQAQDLVSAAH
ncbi:hypothetical protein DWU98_09315 [Dyella monticola]|uniref:Uncharacterized protein n=1 Tax=Dyella monticola TaxID=1927958 RepID=A0A370X1I0_9GAMM|nr:hypothetical protein DWU98_09315 [Dyella monticola]